MKTLREVCKGGGMGGTESNITIEDHRENMKKLCDQQEKQWEEK